MSGIPGLKVRTDLPPGGWGGPTLSEVGPDPVEEGVTRFIIHVKYHGGFQPNPRMMEVLKGCQNLVSLNDTIAEYERAKSEFEADMQQLDALMDRYSTALKRVNALVDERVRRETVRAHQRANAAEAEYRKLKDALATVGMALGRVQE